MLSACASAPSQRQTVQVVAPPPAPVAPTASMVRVIHASPETFAQTVVAYLDNGPTPVIPQLTFRTAAGYMGVPAGTHSVQARLPTMPANGPAPVNWNTPELLAGHSYTIIAHGLASDLTGPQITFAIEEDMTPARQPGRAHLRFFHALVGGGTVDVCLGPATPAFAGVAYGSFAEAYGARGHYVPVTPGSMQLTFRATAQGGPCTGRVVGSVPLSLVEGASVLLIATGRLLRGAGGVPPELLVCIDTVGPDAACTPIPVTPGR